jgi:hypothetical protein
VKGQRCCTRSTIDHSAFDSVVEDGPIEMATAIFYLAGALFFWMRSSGRWWSQQRTAALILLAGGTRELDLHNRITSAYALNTRYFVNPNVPVLERLIVVAILAGLGILIADFVRKGWKEFLQVLAQFQPRALCIAAGVSLPLSQSVSTVFKDFFAGRTDPHHRIPYSCCGLLKRLSKCLSRYSSSRPIRAAWLLRNSKLKKSPLNVNIYSLGGGLPAY